ncbi:MAG: hypothetical protein DI586_10500 [Micavibrio aeruginosavorus]|uniref:Peptidase inhibitor I78 family protein n=1 Tax=Micavibrio aeruginosavorus TaxID=349221 RepID=A0A2W5HEH3_9BACT|nr:MAG: hypothetical protein DI586_10500 [Micavibrio aeruginosavorus]
MAKNTGKIIGFTLVGVTTLLTLGGVYGLVNSAVSADAGPDTAATIEASPQGNVAVGEAVPAAEAPSSECSFNEWVGKTASEAEAAAKETGRPYRMLPPGAAMTMDYRADRINVELNDQAVVTKVSCG